MCQVLGPHVSPIDPDKSLDQVGSDLLAPQMRRWEVDTCGIKRSGVLRSTDVVRKKEPQALSWKRDQLSVCWMLSPCQHCKSHVQSKQGWLVTLLPVHTLDSIEGLEMKRLSGP